MPFGSESLAEEVAAAEFILDRAARVQRALRDSGNRVLARQVLAAQEQDHATWLRVISHFGKRHGADCEQRLASLYSFHGRVAGVLERDIGPALAPEATASARRLLADTLDRLTDEGLASMGLSCDGLFLAPAESLVI